MHKNIIIYCRTHSKVCPCSTVLPEEGPLGLSVAKCAYKDCSNYSEISIHAAAVHVLLNLVPWLSLLCSPSMIEQCHVFTLEITYIHTDKLVCCNHRVVTLVADKLHGETAGSYYM